MSYLGKEQMCGKLRNICEHLEKCSKLKIFSCEKRVQRSNSRCLQMLLHFSSTLKSVIQCMCWTVLSYFIILEENRMEDWHAHCSLQHSKNHLKL